MGAVVGRASVPLGFSDSYEARLRNSLQRRVRAPIVCECFAVVGALYILSLTSHSSGLDASTMLIAGSRALLGMNMSDEQPIVNGKSYHEKSVALNPEDSNTWHCLGTAGGGMIDGRNYTEIDCYVRALYLAPALATSWNNIGAVGGGEIYGRKHSRKACYAAALILDPALSLAWSNLGEAGGGSINGAVYSSMECLKRALDLNPRSAHGWFSLGAAGGGSNTECYANAVSLEPKFGAAWFHLGSKGGGAVDGRFVSERCCYEKALSLDGSITQAWIGLAAHGGGKVKGVNCTANDCFEMVHFLDPEGKNILKPGTGTEDDITEDNEGFRLPVDVEQSEADQDDIDIREASVKGHADMVSDTGTKNAKKQRKRGRCTEGLGRARPCCTGLTSESTTAAPMDEGIEELLKEIMTEPPEQRLEMFDNVARTVLESNANTEMRRKLQDARKNLEIANNAVNEPAKSEGGDGDYYMF